MRAKPLTIPRWVFESTAGSNAESDTVGPPARRFHSGARAARLAATALVIALLTVELALAARSVFSVAGSLTSTSLAWLAVAAVGAVASMVAFAGVRQLMLRAAGVRVRLTQSVGVSYAAGALNTTMPGGGLVSTAYTFRRLRRWGAPPAVAAWCVAVTGLLATATLTALGATGLILSGDSTGSPLKDAAEITGVVLLLAGIAILTSNPDRLAVPARAVLRWVNRLRGRPTETGYARLSRFTDDLDVIRPSRRSWVDAWTLSLLNWALDVACLAACCAAFGVQVGLPALLLTYAAGMAATGLTPLPGGLGVVEAALLVGLTAAGAPWKAALAAVVVYRLLSVGSVALIGWGVIGVRRLTDPAHGDERADPMAIAPPSERTRLPEQVATESEPAEPAEHVDHVQHGQHAEHAEHQSPTRAGDVMRVVLDSVAPGDSWQRVAKTMRRLQVSTVPVCDEHGHLRGIVDYRDIGLRCLAAGGSVATAASLAQDPVMTVGPDDAIEDVARLMAKERAWLVPVLEGARLVGVLHFADIVATSATSAQAPPPVPVAA